MAIDLDQGGDVEFGRRFYAVLPAGKPIAKAVWTESRELAQDMLDNHRGDGPMELWCATRMAGPG
ncbi:MAG: hypothetical protein ABW136_03325 [Steroidobacteraceae bacterium]